MTLDDELDSMDAESTASDAALLAAGASVLLALYEFYVAENERRGLFVGQWAPTILAFASYLKNRSIAEHFN